MAPIPALAFMVQQISVAYNGKCVGHILSPASKTKHLKCIVITLTFVSINFYNISINIYH